MRLRNLRFWNGQADSLEPEGLSISITGSVFDAIGPDADVSDAGDKSIDMAGAFGIPGLIDAHVHLCLDPEVRDPFAHGLVPADQQLSAMAARTKAMLRAGITTARDLGGGQWLELEIRDRIERGEIQGSRLICAGQPITSPGGHCHFWGGEAAGSEDARVVFERQISKGVDLIKVMATGGNLTPGSTPKDSQFNEAVLTDIVGWANEVSLHTAAHCHGAKGIGEAVRAGITTIEHCSWVGEEGWGKDYNDAVVEEMARRGTWVSPTVNKGWSRYLDSSSAHRERVKGNFLKMKEAGVRFIASTDAGIPGVFHHHLPLALPVFSFFLDATPAETLKTATSDCATALGLGHRLGYIKPGYEADMVFYHDNPLENLDVLANPVAVLARGQLMMLNSD